MVFAVLIGMNVYFFFLRGGTSLRALMKTTELAQANGVDAGRLRPAAAPAPASLPGRRRTIRRREEARVVEGTMADNDTVERRWKADGLPPATVNALATSLGKVFDLRTVRAGHGYSCASTPRTTCASSSIASRRRSRITSCARPATDLEGDQGREAASRRAAARSAASSARSLYDAIKRTGESTSLVGWFVDTFAWDINFYIDSNAGDRFKIIVEKKYLGGKFYKYGRVLAAEYKGRTGTFRAFWFQPADGITWRLLHRARREHRQVAA